MKTKLLMAGAALAAGVLASAPAFAVTLNWTFTGTNDGSGQMTVDANNQVTAFDGKYDGQTLTFYANPNFPGTFNLHEPHTPNTGGADLIADDFYNPATGVDVNGILVSTGAGDAERVFDISLDNSGATQTDFFSINPDGGYRLDNGTFSTTAVPEPATWAMMLVGFGGLGAAMRSRRKALVAAA